MKLSKKLFDEIIYTVEISPYESGGFLGGVNDTVTNVVYDSKNSYFASYIPDNDLLNDSIRTWAKNSIEFLGMFHTHYPNCASMSLGDEKFISELMKNICDENDILYFPIVIARKEISVYAAKLINSKCEIKKDELILLG